MTRDRVAPAQPGRHPPGRWMALALAILVNLLFLGVLLFSVSWRNPKPDPVSAELYAPAAKTPVTAPVPEPPQRPEPKEPPPKPEPKVAPPKPEAKAPPPRPEPKTEPDKRAADIALKARQEEDKKQRDQQARERADTEKKRKEIEEKKKAEEKRLAEQRERQQRATDAMKAQAERESQQRKDAEAAAKAKAEAQAKALAEAQARAKMEADWIRRVQAKIRGNVILPPDIPGNPEAIFEVVQLPTGEILDVQLRKSSGARAYDDAVQRAILKSTPLPRPDRTDLFQRTLTLKFRPLD